MSDLSLYQKKAYNIAERCTRCGDCLKQCAFLCKYGMPGNIAADVATPEEAKIAFHCSLCGLCDARCPESINISEYFLSLRYFAMNGSTMDCDPYGPLLRYEAIGSSRLFTWQYIPEGCDTVLFPGCALPGMHADIVQKLFWKLREHIPNLGIILDCCRKPSHDLGLQERFSSGLEKVLSILDRSDITRILVACPNCHKVFRRYASTIKVETVYETLAETNCTLPRNNGYYAIHDPCPLRFEQATQKAVRTLLKRSGTQVSEMKNTGEFTLCCGEGGAVGFVKKRFAARWSQLRRKQANGQELITYCAGCEMHLSRGQDVRHLLNMILCSKDSCEPKRSPFTYFARLKLKWRFMRSLR